jgi:hypothetical protein
MAFFACPVTCIYALLTQQIRFFRRVRGSSAVVDAHIGSIVANRMVVLLYPEGTRNLTGDIIPLKKGALMSVYARKLRLQVMHVANKELVLDERKMNVHTGICCNIRMSSPIDSSQFDDFDAFYAQVVSVWSDLWHNPWTERHESSAMGTTCTDATDDSPRDYHTHSPPLVARLGMIGVLAVGAYLTRMATFCGIPLTVWSAHIAYGGLVACARYIAPVDASVVQSFSRMYNHLQILTSLYMSYIGWECLDRQNPFLTNDFDAGTYAKVRWLLLVHAWSKVLDMTDTCILVAKGKRHGTIGLVWFYLLRFPNINALYFGAFINSIVHSVMYLYYAYSVRLRCIKFYITRLQMLQFVLCLVHAVAYILVNERSDQSYLGYVQVGYMSTMLVLFGNLLRQESTSGS